MARGEGVPDKLCMIRYPWQWPEYKFGVFWDSWGTHKDTARMLGALETPALADSWKTRVRGGEISCGFGEPPGDSPDDTMAKSHHIDWIECLIRRCHWNHLGRVSCYDWKKPAAANGQRLQKSFGYRFVVEEVSYPVRVVPGGAVELMRVSLAADAEQLTHSRPGVAHYHPTLSPDGKLIAFGSNRDGSGALYGAGADGGNIRAITTPTPGRIQRHAHWQPLVR